MIIKVAEETVERIVSRGQKDVFSLKILSLLRAYGTEYDFCSFYAQKDMLLAKFYGDFIISCGEDIEDEDVTETAEFLTASGFSSVLTNPVFGGRLNELLMCDASESVLLEYEEKDKAYSKKPIELNINPGYDRVYEILATGFPKLKYSDWYVDTNHRVRHGVTKVLLWRDSVTATISYELYGYALLSMVASDKNNHIKGAAAELLRLIGSHNRERGLKTQVLCRPELIPFYKKAGFEISGGAAVLRKEGEK